MAAIAIALGVAIVAYIAIVLLFPGIVPEEKEDFTKQALERIYEETTSQSADLERDTRVALRTQLNEEKPWIRFFYSTPLTRPMYDALVGAGYIDQAMNVSVAFIVGCGALWWAFSFIGFGLLSPVLGIIASYFWAYHHCQGRIKKRNRQFLDQFPDAIDMVVRSIRAGFPLNTALQMISDNMQEPTKTEFRYVLNDLGLGRSINEALTRLCTRINGQDVRFFAVMVTIQQETGGNLAEVLGNLSGILRKRKLLRDKLRALTSEGRATAWILSALPVLVFLVLSFMQPAYLVPLWTDPLGMVFFGIAIFLIVICHFVCNQMISIDI
jgi:Flp pilus assembly protein TadB